MTAKNETVPKIVAPLPTKPREPEVGFQVRVNIGTLTEPRWRPAVITEVWPGEFGPKKPAGVNLTIFLSGLNDRAALEKHYLDEGNHKDNAANQALACCSRLVWHLTSRPYGEAHGDWGYWGHGNEVADMEAILAAPVEQRAEWADEYPFSFAWCAQKDLAEYLEKRHADRQAAMRKALADRKEAEQKEALALRDSELRDSRKADGPQEPSRDLADALTSEKEPDVAFDGKPETAPEEDGGSDQLPESTPGGQPITP